MLEYPDMTAFLCLIWLGVCACQDWQQRVVSNWLSMPPLILGLCLRIVGLAEGSSLLVGLILLGSLAVWLLGWAGGADIKVTAALALLDPRLAIYAWSGELLWGGLLYLYARLIVHDRDRLRLPAMLGFFVGLGGFVLWH